VERGAGIRQRIDGDWFPVDPIDLLPTRLSQDDYGTGGDDPLKGLYDAAETFANSEIVEAIAESFFKYAFKKNPPKPGYNADDDFGTLDQLEAVYEKDPGVLVARNAYQGYHHHDEIREDRFVAKSMAFESSKRGLEALKAARLGCEIERDWNMLGHYAYANSVDDLIDYAEHHVKPIHSMDKEISQFDGWISNLTGSLANADVALGEVIARGMDDKEE
jgi:hypothetical protein